MRSACAHHKVLHLIYVSFFSILSTVVFLHYCLRLNNSYFSFIEVEPFVLELVEEGSQYQNEEANRIQKTKTTSRALNIAHITPLYSVSNCDSRFCPFNQEQSLVIASMIRAQSLAKRRGVNVTLATSVWKEDRDIVPPKFLRLQDLSRSLLTEFPQLREHTNKSTPFLGDIFDNLKSFQNYEIFDYIIYTNADIIVHEDFYNIVESIITTDGYDGFTINRVTLPENKNFTELDLKTIYNLNGGVHPGTDCFIMKRSLFEKIYMGNIFLGQPPVGRTLLNQVQSYAEKFKTFHSHDLNATFHLGDPRTWKAEETITLKNFEQFVDIISKICTNEIDKVETNVEHNDDLCSRLQEIKRKMGLSIQKKAVVKTPSDKKKENKTSPLYPPYRILQYGEPRSGSTFQFVLLQAILSLKSQHDPSLMPLVVNHSKSERLSEAIKADSFLLKVHNITALSPEDLANISVFSSVKSTNKQKNFFRVGLYTQLHSNLLSCSLCEVDQYVPYFNLSDEDVHHIKYFLSKFEIIRRCCGLQMSKYEMKRLHNCDMTPFKTLPDYPNCEQYNKAEIELELIKNPGRIMVNFNNPELNWNKLGDCKYYDDMIVEKGLGHNGKPLQNKCSDKYK